MEIAMTVVLTVGIIVGATYAILAYAGGHIDGSVSEEFARDCREFDFFNGIGRAIYEVGYRHGGKQYRIVRERAEQRKRATSE